jgi:hypothetical protein
VILNSPDQFSFFSLTSKQASQHTRDLIESFTQSSISLLDVFCFLQKYFGEDFYQGEETEKPTFKDDDEDDDYDDGMLDVAEAIFTIVVVIVNMSYNLTVH